MNNDSKFSSGLILGIIIGGGAVFLLGTKTGKNLLKILSEQGLDGLTALLEEYGIGEDLEEDEYEEVSKEEHQPNGEAKHPSMSPEQEKPEVKLAQAPKKRFFKRIRK